VGKTSLTNLLASSEITPTPASRTVGEGSWNVQVRLHEYPNSVDLPPSPTWTSPSSSERSEKFPYPPKTPSDILYFVEFYDLNSDLRMRRDQRDHFYKNIDGIVLVYNLQDLRSQDNLHDWLYEPLRQICKHRHRRTRPILRRQHVPILVVGTRLDKLVRRPLRRGGSIAHQLAADECLLLSLSHLTITKVGLIVQNVEAYMELIIYKMLSILLWFCFKVKSLLVIIILFLYSHKISTI